MAKPAAKSAKKPAAKARPKSKSDKATANTAQPYAMVATGPGDASVFARQDITLGKPKKGELLIRHTSIGINFIDIYQRDGLYQPAGGYPAILGSEAAGVIEAVGAGVTGFKPGDRVAYPGALGAYCSHRIIPADKVVKVPPKVRDVEASAAMLKGLTVQYLLHDSYKVKAGDMVLVHAAAGGLGLMLGQWLKAKGAIAIGTAGGPDKCKLAKANGYAHVIDYKKEDFVERVKKITKGKGVDVVYDSVGKDTYPGSLQVLRRFGTFVAVGQSSGIATDFKLADLAANGSLFATRPTLFHFIDTPGELQRRARQLFSMIGSGKVKIAVRQRFALADVGKAHKALEGRKTTGQSVLIP